MGSKIPGVLVVLKNGMSYRGIEITDRTTPGHRYFKFRGVPFMAIASGDIKAVKPTEVFEGEVYSPLERYRQKLAREMPKTADANFRFGEWCMENELAEEAEQHFAKCQLLDESYVERCKDKQPLLAALRSKTEARSIYQELLQDKAAGRIGKVLRAIDLLASKYSDFPENSSLAKEKILLVEMRKKQLRREVIGLFYMYMDKFVQKCAHEKKSETPAIPIKVVTLTSGTQLEGTLEGSEDADVIMLKYEGRNYSIKREYIARMETRLVEKGPFRWRTLAECRQYVTDKKGGITADIVGAVGKDLEIDDKQVLDIWGKRLSDVFEVDPGGGIKEPEVLTTFQDARWGSGSWLRGGGGTGGTGAGGSTPGRTGLPGGQRNPRNPRGQQVPGGQQQQQQDWDDPETWWGKQPLSVKEMVLKAMCAEAIMKVEKVYTEPCSNCGGSGSIEVLGVAGGGRFRYPCSVCRGSGTFTAISYR
jgi:hypothetical protein